MNILTTTPTGNSARRYVPAPISDDNTAQRAIRTLDDWLTHSSPGDFARAVWVPRPVVSACYGANVPTAFLQAACDLLTGGERAFGDLAFLNCGRETLAIMPAPNFVTLAGADQ